MPVLGLNHINIRTPEFTRTVKFLRDALGMQVSAVPGHESIEKAAWVLDDRGNAVLHLASADVPYSPSEVLPAVAPRGSGAIHHIAFSCTDIAAMRARLLSLDIRFRESHHEKARLRQIFVQDPSEITFELNFSGE